MKETILILKHGPDEVEVPAQVKTREFKHYNKITYNVELKVGDKKYKVRQDFESFHEDPHLGRYTKNEPREEWYLTTSQMRSIILNCPDDILINHKSTFDGMIDGTRYIDSDFEKPSPELAGQVLSQLKSRGLMRCHYNSREKAFKLWSCVDNYELKVTCELEFL